MLHLRHHRFPRKLRCCLRKKQSRNLQAEWRWEGEDGKRKVKKSIGAALQRKCLRLLRVRFWNSVPVLFGSGQYDILKDLGRGWELGGERWEVGDRGYSTHSSHTTSSTCVI